MVSRTAAWALYWCCILAAVFLTLVIGVTQGITDGIRSESYGFLRFTMYFLVLSFPFLLLTFGTPPGYTALNYYRDRVSPDASPERSTAPSTLRTGIELTSATVLTSSLLGIFLFTKPRFVQPRYRSITRTDPSKSTAEAIGLVSDPLPVYLLSVFGLTVAASWWFVLWVTR